MAFIDSNLEFASALDLSAGSNGTAAAHDCTNYIDLEAAGRLAGEPLFLEIHFTTAFDSGTDAATITFKLETDADGDFSSGATALWTSDAITVGSDIGDGTDKIQVPINMRNALRYLNLEYTIGTEAATAGVFDAYIVKDVNTA